MCGKHLDQPKLRLSLNEIQSSLSRQISSAIRKNGQIDHFGTHEELIANDRFYKESYLVQQFEEEYGA